VEKLLSADATPTGIVDKICRKNFMFGKTSALQEEKASIALSGHFSIPSSAINFHFWHQISNSPTIKIIFNTLFKNLNQCISS